nr:lipoate biosynthesis protein B [Cavernulicola chilensis]
MYNHFQIHKYSTIPIELSWVLQKAFFVRRFKNYIKKEKLLILNHPITFTLGQKTNKAFIKDFFNWKHNNIHKIERGGEVTCHTPGQILVYIIMDLSQYQHDLHWYIYTIENIIIQLLYNYDIQVYRIHGLPGVWFMNYKIASVGVKVSKWITLYGFSINLNINLGKFTEIIPCGIFNKELSDLNTLLFPVSESQVKRELIQILKNFFKDRKGVI